MSNPTQTARDSSFPRKIRHILVPIDMAEREQSEPAIEMAAWLARQTGARITALTVAKPLGDAFTEMPEVHQPEFEGFVAERSDHHAIPIEALFRSHEAIDHVIREVIDQLAVDFVVMATHQPRISDHLFGSHASQTALHNDCSVLVLRNSS